MLASLDHHNFGHSDPLFVLNCWPVDLASLTLYVSKNFGQFWPKLLASVGQPDLILASLTLYVLA